MKYEVLYLQLVALADTHGYWSNEVKDFNSNLPYSAMTEINSRYLAK
jgi:hypothetical protein